MLYHIRLILLGLLFLFTLSISARDSIAKHIGVVHPLKIWDAYERHKDLSNEIKAKFNSRIEALRRDRLKLKEAIKELEILSKKESPSLSPETILLKKQALELDMLALNDKNHIIQKEIDALHAKSRQILYAKITSAINTVAEKHQLDLVLRAPKLEHLKLDHDAKIDGQTKTSPRNARALVRDLRQSIVVYYNKKSNDITEEVIALLNKEYASSKKVKSSKPMNKKPDEDTEF